MYDMFLQDLKGCGLQAVCSAGRGTHLTPCLGATVKGILLKL